MRETGIIEEILLENKHRNPEYSYALFDTLLWEKVYYQENLTLYLNTTVTSVKAENSKLISVYGIQMNTEKRIEFFSKQFIDCSGDGIVSELSGAEYMFGRESKSDFNEPNAVDESDTVTMGNTIQFRSLDAGHPVPFERPEWAYDFSKEKWAADMKWVEISSGYWWLELGGTKFNVVSDCEEIKEELLKVVYGVWDYIKNHSDKKEDAANYYLDWVGFLPSKRESRRVFGDYVLSENDILENKIFEDAISYGGWHIDTHRPEMFFAFVNNKPHLVDKTVMFEGIYTVPYRSIYSKDIENLYLGGRIISATHRAFASTRVMATCAVAAQAAGTAAALAVHKNKSPRELGEDIGELQQLLLRDGCYIPGYKNEDTKDKALLSHITASSEEKGFEAINVINGISRPVGDNSNMWQSAELSSPQSISLKWDNIQNFKKLYVTFDSDLSVEIMPSLSKWHRVKQSTNVPDTIVRDYKVKYILNGKIIETYENHRNHQRVNIIDKSVSCDEIKITVNKTHGCNTARILEIRAY